MFNTMNVYRNRWGKLPEVAANEGNIPMYPTTRKLAAGLLAATIAIASANTANAKNEFTFDFSVHTNSYSSAAMVFNYQNGKYVWDNKRFTLGFTAKGDAGRHNNWLASIDLVSKTARPETRMVGKIPNKDRKLNHSDKITFSHAFLAAYAPDYADYCNRNGKAQKLVKDGFHIQFEAVAANSRGRIRRDAVSFPVRIVCMPKPNDPARTPVDLKVTQVKLYTIPAQPVCGKPVQLITEIWTNKPGKVDFFLTRSDGPKQPVSVTTQKVANGYVKRWGKTYTHKKSVDLSYQVVLAKQPMTSNWAKMKLNCGVGADVSRTGDLVN